MRRRKAPYPHALYSIMPWTWIIHVHAQTCVIMYVTYEASLTAFQLPSISIFSFSLASPCFWMLGQMQLPDSGCHGLMSSTQTCHYAAGMAVMWLLGAVIRWDTATEQNEWPITYGASHVKEQAMGVACRGCIHLPPHRHTEHALEYLTTDTLGTSFHKYSCLGHPYYWQWLWSCSLTKLNMRCWNVERHTPASRGLICPQRSHSLVAGLDMSAFDTFDGDSDPTVVPYCSTCVNTFSSPCVEQITFPSWQMVRKSVSSPEETKGVKSKSVPPPLG